MMGDTIKPTLHELFILALSHTREEDLNRRTETKMELQLERSTFHERTVSNFILIASAYYSKEEIREWMEDNLMN